MATAAFDLFRMDPSGHPIWMGMSSDLKSAAIRMKQLARTTPGEYFIFNQSAQKIVVTESASANPHQL